MTDVDRPDLWRREPCLGCGEVVKRARDAYVTLSGTRSGSWLVASAVSAGQGYSDGFPPPAAEQLVELGVSHSGCLRLARDRLRAQAVSLPETLPLAQIEVIDRDHPNLNLQIPTATQSCPFCDEFEKDPSDEDIFPKWLLKELVNLGARIRLGERWTSRPVGPTTYACRDCNNTWMSTLENDVQPILRRLFGGSTSLGATEQAKLSLWATMKAVLVDSATTTVVPRGFGRDLKIRKAVPAGVQVWVAAFSDELGSLSAHPWLIHAEDTDPEPDQVIAYCVTIVVFKVVFQVSIPFFDGMQTEPNDFLGAVVPIWPHSQKPLNWPPPFSFDRESVMALATRIYDNREPVITNVTLTSTTAER